MADEINVASDALVAGGGNNGVRLGMDAAAQLIALSARHTHLLAHAIAEIGAVFSSARRAVISGRDDLIVAYDDRAVLPAQARRAFEHRLGDVQIIILLYDPFHGASLPNVLVSD